MFKTEEGNNYITFAISSEMKLVDRIANSLADFAASQGGGSYSDMKLVIRELLINAIEHGNKNDPGKSVSCRIEKIASNRFKVLVSDEGEGFDHASLEMGMPGVRDSERKRGLPLVNTLSDELIFNEKGNAVTVFVSTESNCSFNVVSEGNGLTIMPEGNITASNSDGLRTLLNDALADGVRSFVFDVKNVEDIDSVGLSSLIVLYRSLTKKAEPYSLSVINASKDVSKLFEMTHIGDLYEIKDHIQGI